MHLSRLPSGRWRVAVKHDGQRVTGTADSRAEAARLGAQLLLDLGGTPRSDATVEDLLSMLVAGGESRWSPTYRADVVAVIDRIPPSFTARPARKVTPAVVAGLYRQLAAADWSPHRLRRLHEVLSSAWAGGLALEAVGSSPMAAVRKPSSPRRHLTVPTHDQVAAVVAAAIGTDQLALRLAATLGTRRGETVALRWSDVDFDTATVVVRRSLAYTAGSGVVERGTKTGEDGQRPLAVDLPLVAMLRRHRTAQLELALSAGIEARWVLSDDAGLTPWRPDRLTRVFAAARRRAGVAGVRLHDLRHYVATTMLHDGASAIEVAGVLGHASTATTLDVYAHYLPGRGRAGIEQRAARLQLRDG